MKIIRRLIDYLRWRCSEEGKQTRAFEREHLVLWRKKVKARKVNDKKEMQLYHINAEKLRRKYPLSKQAIRSVLRKSCPSYLSQEEWDLQLITLDECFRDD